MLARCVATLKPPPELTLSQWADRYRMLSAESSAEPGRWHTDKAPYQREIMDAIGDAHIRRVVIMCAAQLGKTELLLNILGYFMAYAPAPILVMQPTLDMGQTFSKDRLAPMIRDTPVLRGLVDVKSRYAGNTILKKNFPGGHITIVGANSATGLASRPIKVLLADEVDRYPGSAGTEGDPLSLAQKRQTTFWDTPRYLAEVVRQAPPVHTFFRDTFFTNVKKSTTERVDIDLVKGDRRMAAFVHPRVGGKVLKASGYKTESYKPPLVNPCDITTADRYMTRMPGEDLYSGETPAQRSAQQLMEEYSRLNDATTRREEWMAVQAIVTGQVPVVGEGVNEIIDFGFTNTETLTGTAQWGKSAAKISDNLEDWADKVLTNGFANVDMAIMGKTALRNFLADEKISKMLDNRRVEMGLIHPRDLPNGVKYVGHLNSPNIDIYTYAEVYLDDWTDPAAPKTLPLVPENKVVLIASHPDYMMAYGACTYIEDSTQQWVTAQTDRLLRSFVKHQPDRRMLELQARPLPIPDKVDSWFVATVC